MTKQFGALRECFVAEFIFRDTAEGELESAEPKFRHLLVHRLKLHVRIDVVVAVSHPSVFLRTFVDEKLFYLHLK